MNSALEPPALWLACARQALTQAARRVEALSAIAPATPATQGDSAGDRPYGGVFVTLLRFRRLRACIGTLEVQRPLLTAIRATAASAALHDSRFGPVVPGELPDIRIELSILSPPLPMRSISELEIGRHGVLIRHPGGRGLFLPRVAIDHRLDAVTFLSRCCEEKAGLSAEAWREPRTQVLLFTTDVYHEDEPPVSPS